MNTVKIIIIRTKYFILDAADFTYTKTLIAE